MTVITVVVHMKNGTSRYNYSLVSSTVVLYVPGAGRLESSVVQRSEASRSRARRAKAESFEEAVHTYMATFFLCR